MQKTSVLECNLPDIKLVKPSGLSNRLFFRVYSGPNPIAFAQLSKRPGRRRRTGLSVSSDSVPGVSYCLSNIEVSQNYRNKGVGSALLDEVISFCQEERVQALYGEARGDIEALRRWYRDKGFNLDGVDEIHMLFNS